MKITMPKTFQPDPALSAEAAQRISQKASLQATNSSMSASDEGADRNRESDTLKAASTVMNVASYLPIGMKAKLALTAASYAADKIADLRSGATDSTGPLAGERQRNQMMLEGATSDVARSVPLSANGVMATNVQEARQDQHDGPRQ